MRINRWTVGCASAVLFGGCLNARADVAYVDPCTAIKAYTASSVGQPYAVYDEGTDRPGTWTSGGGSLVYSRPNNDPSNPNPPYVYRTSVLLTTGATPQTGSTAGQGRFTVSGSFDNIAPVNTAQPGLVVSASTSAGGYLLAVDNALNSDFALLAVTGAELLADEGVSGNPPGTQQVVKDLVHPTTGHSYAVSVTQDRSGAHPVFTVVIDEVTPGGPVTNVYSGTFDDPNNPSDFGGTQIGYRVRDPLDAQTPTFGPLTLAVPEPGSLAVAALSLCGLLARRRGRRLC